MSATICRDCQGSGDFGYYDDIAGKIFEVPCSTCKGSGLEGLRMLVKPLAFNHAGALDKAAEAFAAALRKAGMP